MKTNGVVIFIAVLLGAIVVNAQQQEINGLKTKTITLSRKASKDKTAPPRIWILSESEGRQVKPVEYKGPPSRIDKNPSEVFVDASSSALNVGQVQIVNLPKRRYSIVCSAFSRDPDDLWLRVEAALVNGMGVLKDLGKMKWSEVDRMPALVLQPITPQISFSIRNGVRSVGPEGLIARAVAGHVYAAQIKDERTDYRVIFRVDSIDANGDCHISWKRIPAKWARWTSPARPKRPSSGNVSFGMV